MIIRIRPTVHFTGACLTLLTLAACGNNGAPPYPPEPPQAMPGTAATSVVGAPPTARAKSPGTSAPVPPDPHVVYDLREKCGEDARRWYEHFLEDGGTHSQQPAARRGFTSHYNTRSNECFAVTSSINSIRELKSRQAEVVEIQTLSNVLENKDVGTFLNRADAAAPAECHVAQQVCKSRAEWESLTAPYMSE
jgi:hypothetical protein